MDLILKKLFNSKSINKEELEADKKKDIKMINSSNKAAFEESLKNIENEETKLLKLQKKYSNGEIRGEELTKEQIFKLCALYDRQIAELKKANAIKKQKLLQYRKKLKNN